MNRELADTRVRRVPKYCTRVRAYKLSRAVYQSISQPFLRVWHTRARSNLSLHACLSILFQILNGKDQIEGVTYDKRCRLSRKLMRSIVIIVNDKNLIAKVACVYRIDSRLTSRLSFPKHGICDSHEKHPQVESPGQIHVRSPDIWSSVTEDSAFVAACRAT